MVFDSDQMDMLERVAWISVDTRSPNFGFQGIVSCSSWVPTV